MLTRFKNLRRQKPVNKKLCFSQEEDNDELSYTDALIELHKEWEKNKPKKRKIKLLLKASFKKRRLWIDNDCPSVSDTFNTFPMLRKKQWVSITKLTIVKLVL